MMTKTIATTVLLCLSLSQSSTAVKKSDREHDGLAGPARRVFQEWSPISGYPGYDPRTRCRSMTRIYDRDGRLMQSSVYSNTCGDDETRSHYTYDKDGSRTSRTEEIRGTNSPPPPPPPMAAPGSGSRPAAQSPPRTTFQYDSRGRLSEQAVYRAGGELIYKVVHKYDEKDREAETQSVDKDGSISNRRVYRYEGDSRFPSGYHYIERDGRAAFGVTYTDYELNAVGDWVKRKTKTVDHGGRTRVSQDFRTIEYHPAKK
jgi:hypothetical protein